MRRARTILILCAVALLALGCAAPASHAAPRLTIEGDALVLTGTAGTDSVSLIASTPTEISVHGLTAGDPMPASCAWTDYALRCAVPARIEVRLGDGDDTLYCSGIAPAITIDDGAGNDVIEGGAGDSWFLNGAGDDSFKGDGRDRFVSGPGADLFSGDGGVENDPFLDVLSDSAETRPVRLVSAVVPGATFTYLDTVMSEGGVDGEATGSASASTAPATTRSTAPRRPIG